MKLLIAYFLNKKKQIINYNDIEMREEASIETGLKPCLNL